MFDLSAITNSEFIFCTLASLVMGVIIAFSFSFKNNKSGNLKFALIVLPCIVQAVIMLVNGNIGTGVAVMGAFSLVRFRSAPGNARDIASIFLAMAVGLAMGAGNTALGCGVGILVCLVNIIYTIINSKKDPFAEKELIITIPEGLDYGGIFDDLFQTYTKSHKLIQVKTTNMGSLFKLKYEVALKDRLQEKKFIDEIRTRNGNLEISLGRKEFNPYEEL